MAKKSERPVLVTTEWKGVFFGYEVSRPTDTRIVLRHAKSAIHWNTTKGFVELASDGPNDNSDIGARAPDTIELWGVTSVTGVSKVATKAWEAA